MRSTPVSRTPSANPMAVYRGQIVVVDQVHDRMAIVTDARDVQLAVLTSELKRDRASLMAAMRGGDK